MARFILKVTEGIKAPEATCLDLENAQAARELATLHAAEIMRDWPDLIWDGELRVQVLDEAGFVLFSLFAMGRPSRGDRQRSPERY
ncbi:DUF6894 family protein [Sphingomonas colocasiae]|uniref:DUF6894 domain-containing protein n=1 Tax=Sphingomonas colocasiae TaxID=1848973 RepID=A0ABS7PYP2_9SPHN|nr:hypothetical protein [Sphingomonas colocasiae]MBY8823303.1 hypothetical protein [Sphingomonas colocasiae]MBY8826438.1 hypothetical protein [Sphingomonas colocasiae]